MNMMGDDGDVDDVFKFQIISFSVVSTCFCFLFTTRGVPRGTTTLILVLTTVPPTKGY